MVIAPLAGALTSLLPLVGGYAYAHSPGVISQVIPASTPSVTLNYLNVLARDDGLQGLLVGIFFTGIAATVYRRGQRLGWYAMLFFFLSSIAGLAMDSLQPLPGEALAANVLATILLVLVAAGLVLPYRMFFPTKQRME